MVVTPSEAQQERALEADVEAQERESLDELVLEEMCKLDELYPKTPPCEPAWAKKARLAAAQRKRQEEFEEVQRLAREAAVFTGMEAKSPGSGGRTDVAHWDRNTFECVMKDGTHVPWKHINVFGWTEALRRAKRS